MRERRNQFTIRSLMIAIAIVAVVLAFPFVAVSLLWVLSSKEILLFPVAAVLIGLAVFIVAVPICLACFVVVVSPLFTVTWLYERRKNQTEAMGSRRESLLGAFVSFLTSTHANLPKQPIPKQLGQDRFLE